MFFTNTIQQKLCSWGHREDGKTTLSFQKLQIPRINAISDIILCILYNFLNYMDILRKYYSTGTFT